MKKLLLTGIFLFMAVGAVRAVVSDSLTARAALLAARGDVGELRPLYRPLLPHIDALIGWALEHREAIMRDRRKAARNP